jgi:hypothetical protein
MPGMGDPNGTDAPATGPAEWASPEQQQSQATGMGATGSAMPAMPGTPGANAAAGGTGAERSDASGLLGTETDLWAGASPVAGDPTTVDAPAAEQAAWASADQSAQATLPGTTGAAEPDAVESTEDRIAVVKPSERKEDTTAWDLVAGAGALAFLVPFAVSQAGKGKERSEEELTPEYALRESEPWESAAETELTTYRRKKGEEGTAIVEDRPPPMCSDALPPEPEVVEPEEPEDADEEEPRTAANLLKQTDDAWGKSGTKPLGVLE